MDEKRFALCLRGISDQYQATAENIMENIIIPLKAETFLSTYHNPNLEHALNFYKPVLYCCETNQHNPWFMVATHSINCLLMVKEAIAQGHHYDYIVITRFDAHFEYDFKQLIAEKHISPEHFFVLCETEKTGYVDDMLWIVPVHMIDALIASLDHIRKENTWTHSINIFMDKLLGPNTTKMMFDGQYYLRDHRPFIKLARELNTITLS